MNLISDRVEVLENVDISTFTFVEVYEFLKLRRDFTEFGNSSRNSSQKSRNEEVKSENISSEIGARVIIMLADDFDRFDVDEEVIFDSKFPTRGDALSI